jgi:methylase of polypeptide subunit release factors
MSHFVQDVQDREYHLQGEIITLRQHPAVFPPSPFGIRFAKELDLRAGERVADIGTGTGIHAILAAKKGASEVVATDPCEAAVTLTHFNARDLNDVRQVVPLRGSFFANSTGKFDVITANLPQELVPPEYLAGLSDAQARGVDGGGAGGNALLLDFLEIAHAYMHRSSRLYVIVNTITDYKQTLGRIEQLYRPRLVWEGIAPTKEFVGSAIHWFKELIERRIVDLFQDESGRWHARQYIYELRRA